MIPIKPEDAIWTDEQWQAIYDKGHNIIVSAGAGSGKTAVLSERVLRNLQAGMSIKEILILTFTKAASEEMRERIRKKIKSDKTLVNELSYIDEAYITTFDSFALSVVKKYHYILNVNSDIGITDETIIRIKKKEILESLFLKYYEKENEDFLNLIDTFCVKDDKDIFDSILNIYSKIELKYDRQEYLDKLLSESNDEEKIKRDVIGYEELIKNKIEEIKYLIADLSYYVDNDYIIKLTSSLSNLINSNTYEEIVSNLSVTIPRLPSGVDDEVKVKKESISNVIKEIKKLCELNSVNELIMSVNKTKPILKTIINILKEFDNEVMKYKNENNIYEFTDIAVLAIKLVKENIGVREELRNSFKEIMIDEYQDTSDLQEILINLIENNNVYMVGDIKQSIYRFRNANPNIFKEKYNNYNNHINGEKIDLNKNFRSREEVLNNINLLFNKVMDEEIGGADYIKSHQMVFGNRSYINKGKTKQNYNFELFTYSFDKKNIYTKDEIEAFIIAKDIKNKVDNGYQIFDKDDNILRNANYSDFVILMDRSSSFDLYKRIFLYLNIPLELHKDETMNNDTDTLIINNLLKFILKVNDNVYDKELEYLFTSIMRSFLYEESDEVIFDYIKNNNIFESELYKKCKEINIYNKSSYDIINLIIDKFNFYEKLITIGNITSSNVKINKIIENAKSMADIGYDVYAFSEYLDKVIKEKIDIKYTDNNKIDNSVKIMTIHKSKGLEFPVCYFSGLFKSFNISDIKDKFLYSNKYGIITPYFNEGVGETFYKNLLKSDYLTEEISEKIRLFYVALTRAKEKMILLIPYKDVETSGSDIVSKTIRNKYTSLLDIVYSTFSNLKTYVTNIDAYNIGVTKDYNLIRKTTLDNLLSSSNDTINVEEIKIDNEKITEEKFSKKQIQLIDKEVSDNIKYGLYFHSILESTNLKNINYDNIKDEFIKNKIKKFRELNIFDNIDKAKIYNEYEFIYETDNIKYHGIIDLMLEYDSYIDIIDYKLSNIEDETYLNQLNGYKNYIKSITNKDVNIYLYSIMKGELRKL